MIQRGCKAARKKRVEMSGAAGQRPKRLKMSKAIISNFRQTGQIKCSCGDETSKTSFFLPQQLINFFPSVYLLLTKKKKIQVLTDGHSVRTCARKKFLYF